MGVLAPLHFLQIPFRKANNVLCCLSYRFFRRFALALGWQVGGYNLIKCDIHYAVKSISTRQYRPTVTCDTSHSTAWKVPHEQIFCPYHIQHISCPLVDRKIGETALGSKRITTSSRILAYTFYLSKALFGHSSQHVTMLWLSPNPRKPKH
ncbi:hypothetical protein C0J52_27063 [Blattella germanica]|nr:hypothetical protein C0J52_27063 [Blattella germanica]